MLNSVDFVDPTSNPHANKGILEWSFFNNRPSNIYISLEISNFRSVIIEILVPECKICRKINSIFIQVCRTIFVTRFKMRVFLRHWFKNDMVSKWKELETNYDHIRVSIDVFPACSASGILQDREILSQYEYTNLMEDYFPSMMRIPHDVWGDSPRYMTKLFRSTLLTTVSLEDRMGPSPKRSLFQTNSSSYRTRCHHEHLFVAPQCIFRSDWFPKPLNMRSNLSITPGPKRSAVMPLQSKLPLIQNV